MGLSPLLEGEEGDALLSTQEGDREALTLPAPQVEYIQKNSCGRSKGCPGLV